jgi:sugar O-acyltransferase (sialic acid O-acetyltransferase NeuD family)
MSKLIILGAGKVGAFIAYNHEMFGRVYSEVGLLDDDRQRHGQKINGCRVLGPIADIEKHISAELDVVVGVASPTAKRMVVDRLRRYHLTFPAMVASNAWLSRGVSVGQGVLIYPGVTANHGTTIDDFALINFNCVLGHDASIGKFAFLSPGVNLGGFTTIGDGAQMGIGASTRQNVCVGEDSIVGGMCMVVRDVGRGETCGGVPGRVIRRSENLS